MSIIFEAPAKLNLHLAVGAKRESGKHEIESVAVSLDLCDTLYVDIYNAENSKTTIEMDCSELPFKSAQKLDELLPEDNLVYKAVKLMRLVSDFRNDIKIRITKRIPPGAGLGGGSSDAVAAMEVIADVTNTDIPEIAAGLGSDIPFFILEQSSVALILGEGEIIYPVDPINMHFVLVQPDFSSDTKRGFELLDEARARRGIGGSFKKIDPREIFELPVEKWPFRNDFLPVFMEHGTVEEKAAYKKVLADIENTGALYTNLSGTGSVCYGAFFNKFDAEEAVRCLSARWPFVVRASN